MPQKQNPDALELIRGKSGTAQGRFFGFLTSIKGTPSGYNKDLQEDKNCIFDTFDELSDALLLMNGVISTLKINEKNLRKSLKADMLATDIAYYIVRKGFVQIFSTWKSSYLFQNRLPRSSWNRRSSCCNR